MSKSLGNTISPIDLMKDYGADILRLWALSVDFTEDHRIGKEILAGVADQYRKLRNTFRYLLGALEGFGEEERLGDVSAYPELERYMLHLTAELDEKLRNAVDDFDFNTYVRALTDFCNEDLQRLLLRYPQGRALLRGEPGDGRSDRAAAGVPGGARHAVPRAGAVAVRRCWCSRARKCGARAIRMRDRCICSNGRWCRRSMRDEAKWDEAARASNAGHRGDRAAAAGEGAGVEPRSRSVGPEQRGSRSFSPSCSSPRQSTKAMRSKWRRRATTNAGAAGGTCRSVSEDGALDARCEAVLRG